MSRDPQRQPALPYGMDLDGMNVQDSRYILIIKRLRE